MAPQKDHGRPTPSRASLDAGDEVGTFVTRPLIFAGRELVLNVSAEGWIKVGLLDESGHPFPGLALADCDPVRSDSTRFPVSWRGNDDVSELSGRVVQLQFELRNAKLFALQFDPES